MQDRTTRLAVICGATASLMLTGCGSSSSSEANRLLRQTFSGSHAVKSGAVSVVLTVDTYRPRTASGPLTLSFGGPFQSLGEGRLPASNFNFSISAPGRSGSVGLVSTGTSGYVTVAGASYQLPATTFRQVESSFDAVASSRLGINPLRWVVKASVVGTETIGGVKATHIRAGINVEALMRDLGAFLQRSSLLQAASAGGNPTFDLWTGDRDKTVRKLAINLTVSTSLGSPRAAHFGLTLQYANLNQPQTIQAPSSVRPFSEFAPKARSLLPTLETGLLGAPTK